MNFKLGPFNNRITVGYPTIIKDTIKNQVDPVQPEQEVKPEIEIIMSGEPSLDILNENPIPKNKKKK